MDEQKLNRKLAEWARVPYPTDTWDGIFNKQPDFTQSLDACFKWLVPFAIVKIMAEQGDSSDVAYAILFKKWLQELELIIPHAALALCLAIEKLIDKEAK